MITEAPVLQGKHVRLEPLEHRHAAGLAAASAGDTELYRWSPVPQGEAEATKYVETALRWKEQDFALAFARPVIISVLFGGVPGRVLYMDMDDMVPHMFPEFPGILLRPGFGF